MAYTRQRISRFRSEIKKLIAEIQDYIPQNGSPRDREFHFQRQAFKERCDQAEQLTRQLDAEDDAKKQSAWSRRDGDARRIRESLKLSLDYFRQNERH